MSLDEIIELSAEHNPREEHVHALIFATKDEPAKALGALALDFARQYMSGTLPFDAADAIMNSFFSYANRVLGQWPEPMYSVFLAFDAGEYRHSGDNADIDPIQKYTRPQLAKILENPSAA